MFPLYDENRIKGRIPFVTIGLVLANVFLFFYVQSVDLFVFSRDDLWNGKLYTIFTSMFFHQNLVHLIGNMWFLWIFGENVEARTGSIRFLFFYFLCGAIATLSYVLTNPSSDIPLLGASGAISGVLGGYFVLFPRNKIKAIVPLVFLFIASVPAFIFIGAWFFLQILSLGSAEMVAYSAHVGGFLAGVILIKRFNKRKLF